MYTDLCTVQEPLVNLGDQKRSCDYARQELMLLPRGDRSLKRIESTKGLITSGINSTGRMHAPLGEVANVLVPRLGKRQDQYSAILFGSVGLSSM